MHFDPESHSHPHPASGSSARRGILMWLIAALVLGAAVYLGVLSGRDGASSLDDAGAAALFHRGVMELEQYKYSSAYETFARVAKARPEWPAARFNAGIAALNVGGKDKEESQKMSRIAESELRETLRLAPDNIHARFTLGILLRFNGRFDEASVEFAAAAGAMPDDPFILYAHGVALQENKKLAEARAIMEKAVRLQPSFSSAIYRLAMMSRGVDVAASKANLDVFQLLEPNLEGIKTGDVYGQAGPYYSAIRDPLFRGGRIPPAPKTGLGRGLAEKPAASIAGAEDAVSSRARPDGTPAPRGMAVGDVDGDGKLDLVLAGGKRGDAARAVVYRGDGTAGGFKESAVLEANGIVLGLGDLDGDRDLDLALVGEGSLAVLENGPQGFGPSKLRFPAVPAGFPVRALVFDADSDWDIDLVLVHQAGAPGGISTSLTILNNNRDGSFSDYTAKAALAPVSIAAVDALAADLDGDIDLDVLLLAAEPADSVAIFNDRAFRFRKVPAREAGGVEALLERAALPPALGLGATQAPGVGATLFWDDTGAPHRIVATADGAVGVFAAGATAKNWISFELNGPETPILKKAWANLSGIGAALEVRAGPHVALQGNVLAGTGGACGAPRVVFELPDGIEAIDYLRILWPDGVLQSEPALAARKNHRIEEIQRKEISCPYVFAWTGERFEYAGDYLGVGGLGYLEAPGLYSRPDPTEVLELPPLVARLTRDGKRVFDVRIVEPLEECTYLDAVELIQVDTPSGIRVHPDEIFPIRAPPPSAKLWALREARPPAAARDHQGRDVLAEVLDRDRRYAQNWTRDHRFPGVAEPHALELEWRDDLPLADGALRPVLFLHGYVKYTYSTSNFASAQAGITPRPPTVSVERDGKWVAVREEWGFPAGTPRWMAVDLDDQLRAGDRKLRVATDQEIYWDQAFIAAAEPVPLGAIGEREGRDATAATVKLEGAGTSARVKILAPRRSDLRFHGFPREIDTGGTHPAVYAYPDRDSTANMKPFPGRYTAYGDTRDLVRDADDRLAILGEGDEVALEFDAEALPALEPGWTRTFFLAAVGYCKDMDLYTAGGDRIEPLPFRAMSAYPPPKGERGKAAEAEQRLERVVEPLSLGRP